ncbi:MAG: putative oxidoreductase C-terminal domain-containing protein [Bacteroidota bacterium]|nr:putative oxidoreductase C-terminal domain-containing protein [Bacteroidota bacterium]
MQTRFQPAAALLLLFSLSMSCHTRETTPAGHGNPSDTARAVRLITLDPGHFHAALVQKSMYPDVDSVVHVYAPPGPDLDLHLDRIKAYNNREKDPTHWSEQVYSGTDFFEKMLAGHAGNTVVLSGNTREKADYIFRSLQSGYHVLADKPMVIDPEGFARLEQAFAIASRNDLLLYDIMTERFEITSVIQRELCKRPDVFGTFQKSNARHPAVIKESVHHFFKQVSGATLTRPPWFFDIRQQGEGMVDVMTHLVDLAQWECFPDQALDYKKDVLVESARHWPTNLSPVQFRELTRLDSFPDYLKGNVTSDGSLQVYCNGEIRYALRGVGIRTTATWTYKDSGTMDDTYYSMLHGTKADLVIRQGAAEGFKPTLYIEPLDRRGAPERNPQTAYEQGLYAAIASLQKEFPGLGLERTRSGWRLVVPDKYKEGHEAHFARVMRHFLGYLRERNMPAWEVPDMLAKYYTTTRALELARRNK